MNSILKLVKLVKLVKRLGMAVGRNSRKRYSNYRIEVTNEELIPAIANNLP